MPMSKNETINFDTLYDFNDIQLEITLDCIYSQAMYLLKKIVDIILNTTDIEKSFRIRDILKKYSGACHPRDIDREYRSVYRKIEKLVECVEHNKSILIELAKTVGMEMKINADPTVCIEEAIEWTLKSQ